MDGVATAQKALGQAIAKTVKAAEKMKSFDPIGPGESEGARREPRRRAKSLGREIAALKKDVEKAQSAGGGE